MIIFPSSKDSDCGFESQEMINELKKRSARIEFDLDIVCYLFL
jgi:hypothetical protein